MFIVLKLLRLLLAIAIVALALLYRMPFWANWRSDSFLGIVIVGLALLVSETFAYRRNYTITRTILSSAILLVTSLSLCLTLGIETKFYFVKQAVLNTPTSRLESLGKHFVVGYRDLGEVKQLVEKKAVSGFFLTSRNIKGRTKEAIAQEIKTLQTIRQKQGLSPLWVAVDQEGGIVSRLSPPLTLLPPLAEVVENTKNIAERETEVIKYATIHGQELAALGVNLNFAPVVDLNYGIINPQDKYSRIYQRAIALDEKTVSQVALWYCQTLEEFQVSCTLKHFPGLGSIAVDTHLNNAELTTTVEKLTQQDWLPFQEVASKSSAFTMLGHVKLTAVDSENPVSFSEKVVKGIIREKWQNQGILITDDFSMNPVSLSPDGVEGATLKAINGGVDLILISFDQDLFYPAILGLLKAQKVGELEKSMLKISNQRLTKNQPNKF
ncbi:MAG: glycoside hydrolase family 3 N-terminal domain-containing protein [Spirulinaceae cyanobacterium]